MRRPFIWADFSGSPMTVELFTSESVTSGHPDKLCDAISDTIVDACLAIDSNARVAVETLVKGSPDKSIIVLAGEVSLNGEAPDYEALARRAAADIGYVDHAIGMAATTPELTDVHVHITTQAANIAQGVNDLGVAQGAGDQGDGDRRPRGQGLRHPAAQVRADDQPGGHREREGAACAGAG